MANANRPFKPSQRPFRDQLGRPIAMVSLRRSTRGKKPLLPTDSLSGKLLHHYIGESQRRTGYELYGFTFAAHQARMLVGVTDHLTLKEVIGATFGKFGRHVQLNRHFSEPHGHLNLWQGPLKRKLVRNDHEADLEMEKLVQLAHDPGYSGKGCPWLPTSSMHGLLISEELGEVPEGEEPQEGDELEEDTLQEGIWYVNHELVEQTFGLRFPNIPSDGLARPKRLTAFIDPNTPRAGAALN